MTLDLVDLEDLITETVTAACDEDGSIIINWDDLPEPKSIQWIDGSTSVVRTGLTHGDYEADIIFGDGCTLHKEYTIEESTPLSFTGIVQTHHPSSCIESDGSLFMKFLKLQVVLRPIVMCGIMVRQEQKYRTASAIYLYDLDGRLLNQWSALKSSKVYKVDLPQLQGIYYIEVLLNNGETVREQIVKI